RRPGARLVLPAFFAVGISVEVPSRGCASGGKKGWVMAKKKAPKKSARRSAGRPAGPKAKGKAAGRSGAKRTAAAAAGTGRGAASRARSLGLIPPAPDGGPKDWFLNAIESAYSKLVPRGEAVPEPAAAAVARVRRGGAAAAAAAANGGAHFASRFRPG